MFQFTEWVDEQYQRQRQFARDYSQFTRLKENLMPAATISQQYQRFKSSFPLVHSMFTIMVSTNRKSVDFTTALDTDLEPQDAKSVDVTEEQQHKNLQRTILEYFLAFIRLKSQKQLRWWSMLSPLGHYSKGFMPPQQKSHFSASSCNIRVA